MTPDASTVAGGLSTQGLAYLCGLLVVAVVAEFLLLWRVFQGRLEDRDTQAKAVAAANEEAKLLLREVLPVADHLAIAAGRLQYGRKKPPPGDAP